MNIVVLSGTLKADPTMTYTKKAKPMTRFELRVDNPDSPGYYTHEQVLVVGAQAEPLLERLESGDAVELTGKLQRGEVVCFKVSLAGGLHNQRSGGPETSAQGGAERNAPEGEPTRPRPKTRTPAATWTGKKSALN